MANPILGWSTSDPVTRVPVTYQKDGHILTLAPPESGKSRSVCLPQLIRYPGSIAVADFKGEHARATALWRWAMLGQRCVIFDAFRLIEDRFLPPDSYGKADPLDFAARSRSPQFAADKIAKALNPETSHHDPHWSHAAQNFFVALKLFVKTDPRFEPMGMPRTLASVWQILSDREDEKDVLKLMAVSDDALIRDQGETFLHGSKNNEIRAIRNHLRTACSQILGEKNILETISGSNIDFSELVTRPTTVYFVIPGDMGASLSGYLKVLFSMVLSEIERAGLPGHDSKIPRPMLLLDEYATFGNFPIVPEAMGRMRAYCRIWLFLQNLSQLEELNPGSWKTIRGNAGLTQVFGGSNDVFTAEEISKLCGTRTGVARGVGTDGKPGSAGSENYHTYARPLYTPDEIMRLPLGVQILKQIRQNPCEAALIHPSLSDFPDYLGFTAAINKGYSVDVAKRTAGRMLEPRK